jgi:hypothetical protein
MIVGLHDLVIIINIIIIIAVRSIAFNFTSARPLPLPPSNRCTILLGRNLALFSLGCPRLVVGAGTARFLLSRPDLLLSHRMRLYSISLPVSLSPVALSYCHYSNAARCYTVSIPTA